jgi:hypothetical protein
MICDEMLRTKTCFVLVAMSILLPKHLADCLQVVGLGGGKEKIHLDSGLNSFLVRCKMSVVCERVVVHLSIHPFFKKRRRKKLLIDHFSCPTLISLNVLLFSFVVFIDFL